MYGRRNARGPRLAQREAGVYITQGKDMYDFNNQINAAYANWLVQHHNRPMENDKQNSTKRTNVAKCYGWVFLQCCGFLSL